MKKSILLAIVVLICAIPAASYAGGGRHGGHHGGHYGHRHGHHHHGGGDYFERSFQSTLGGLAAVGTAYVGAKVIQAIAQPPAPRVVNVYTPPVYHQQVVVQQPAAPRMDKKTAYYKKVYEQRAREIEGENWKIEKEEIRRQAIQDAEEDFR